jgi:hypothetical protein
MQHGSDGNEPYRALVNRVIAGLALHHVSIAEVF